MAEPKPALPVKLFIAVLYRRQEELQPLRKHLIDAFGDIDYTSPAFPFPCGGYYAEEMGEPLWRIFYSFRELIDPSAIRVIKLRTNEIEKRMAVAGKRTVNLDPGYVDYGKVVLASMKGHNQKVYLGDGVWADINLLYEKGKFRTLDWTFPDFREGLYDRVLLHIRAKYKAAIRGRQDSDPADDADSSGLDSITK